jgi:quercetin dioxygenase-like cupin family protein
MKPYTQTVTGNKILREFAHDTDSHELVWHRDKKDRIVRVIEGNGWKFQLDNMLPILLHEGQEIFIPKETFHRVIKGTNTLKIQITEKD